MIEETLKKLEITLPEPAKPLAAYIPSIKIGNYVYTSGQIPLRDGKIVFTGSVPSKVSIEDAKKAAEICVINCLAAVKSAAGSLESIDQIVKLTVFVNSDAGFGEQPMIANGASELLEKIFGEKGKHTRSAVGASGLPKDSTVEVEMIVQLKQP